MDTYMARAFEMGAQFYRTHYALPLDEGDMRMQVVYLTTFEDHVEPALAWDIWEQFCDGAADECWKVADEIEQGIARGGRIVA